MCLEYQFRKDVLQPRETLSLFVSSKVILNTHAALQKSQYIRSQRSFLLWIARGEQDVMNEELLIHTEMSLTP